MSDGNQTSDINQPSLNKTDLKVNPDQSISQVLPNTGISQTQNKIGFRKILIIGVIILVGALIALLYLGRSNVVEEVKVSNEEPRKITTASEGGNEKSRQTDQSNVTGTPSVTLRPTATSTPTPVTLKWSSFGVIGLGSDKFTAQLTGVRLAGSFVWATVVIKNNFDTTYGINPNYIEMESENTMSRPKNNLSDLAVGPGESKEVQLEYPKLPNPPYKIYYVHETTHVGYDLGSISL